MFLQISCPILPLGGHIIVTAGQIPGLGASFQQTAGKRRDNFSFSL
jgi:hypothetical protein